LLSNRFQEALPVVPSFCLPVVSSCCPRSIGSATNDASFGGYGSSEVRTLAAHYYPTETNNKKLHAEWNNLKFKLVE